MERVKAEVGAAQWAAMSARQRKMAMMKELDSDESDEEAPAPAAMPVASPLKTLLDDGADSCQEAIRYGKRYGKNCMDAYSPAAGKKSALGVLAERAPNRTDAGAPRTSPLKPLAQQAGAVRPRPASAKAARAAPRVLQRPASAHASTRTDRTKRVSLAGLAKLEARERALCSVSFFDDSVMDVMPADVAAASSRPRGGRARAKQRPASARPASAGAPATGRRKKTRPASAPSSRHSQKVTSQLLRVESESSWPSLSATMEDSPESETEQSEPEPEPEPEPEAPMRLAPIQAAGADTLLELHGALDAVQGRGWDQRRLVCGAVLDALADRDASAAGLLRRIGSEMSGVGEVLSPAGGSPKVKPPHKPPASDGASCCAQCGTEKDAAAAAAAASELKAGRERTARAEAAAAHLQRQVSLERSKARDLTKQLEELQAQLQQQLQTAAPASTVAAGAALRASTSSLWASSEYSWDGHSDHDGTDCSESSEEGEQEDANLGTIGLSSAAGRPRMGAAFASIPLQTDYAPPMAARSGGGGSGISSGGLLPLSFGGAPLTASIPLAGATAASPEPLLVQQLQSVRARSTAMSLVL